MMKENEVLYAISLISSMLMACGSDDGSSSKGETTLTWVIDTSGRDLRLEDPLITAEAVREVVVTGRDGKDFPFAIYARNEAQDHERRNNAILTLGPETKGLLEPIEPTIAIIDGVIIISDVRGYLNGTTIRAVVRT
jgi:hypothetical protein